MTLTKAKIADAIFQELGFPKNRSIELLELLLELMKNKLEKGEDVLISGFGKFCVKEKKERRGRNPATGKSITIAASRSVRFKQGKDLKDAVNS